MAAKSKRASRIKVLVVDDNKNTQRELKTILELEEDISVVGFAADGRQAVDKARRLLPDVVLMDYLMPEVNGLEAADILIKKNPDVKVVMLSVVNGVDHRMQGKKVRIFGWLSKSLILPEEIVEAVRKAARASEGGERGCRD